MAWLTIHVIILPNILVSPGGKDGDRVNGPSPQTEIRIVAKQISNLAPLVSNQIVGR